MDMVGERDGWTWWVYMVGGHGRFVYSIYLIQ